MTSQNNTAVIVGTFCFLGIVFGFAAFMAAKQTSERNQYYQQSSLDAERAKFPTKLVKRGPAPDGDPQAPSIKPIFYNSGGKKLKAWLIFPHKRGKSPAVLFAHGGYSVGAGDIAAVRPFVDAGFVVMVPSVRGENGNPGNFELCFGEIDDLKAALNYLAKLPQVDPHMLFAAGHSLGATNVMLLAESDGRLKKVAACGGYPNMAMGNNLYQEIIPFDQKGEHELELRAPALWVSHLTCPMLLCYGSNDQVEGEYKRLAQDMSNRPGAKGKTIIIEDIPGADHFQAITPAIPRMVTFFSQN
ncbi:MAG: aminopeptidase [Candidatus Melainabacteria bacterium]|nr:MAG: aminopeptidase [Candidatus Melainabacteria bacterium]